MPSGQEPMRRPVPGGPAMSGRAEMLPLGLRSRLPSRRSAGYVCTTGEILTLPLGWKDPERASCLLDGLWKSSLGRAPLLSPLGVSSPLPAHYAQFFVSYREGTWGLIGSAFYSEPRALVKAGGRAWEGKFKILVNGVNPRARQTFLSLK